MSADGRYVLFGGVAPNLAAAAAFPAYTYKVYCCDRVPGETIPVVVSRDGAEQNVSRSKGSCDWFAVSTRFTVCNERN